MKKGRFIITASSERMLVRMVVVVKSTDACMDGSISKAQNCFFDVLRNLKFDANKIILVEPTEEGSVAAEGLET